MNKEAIFNQIIAQLRDAQEKTIQARDAAQTEANAHIGRMESRYDTFKEEAQYEVEAHELRIARYQDGIKNIRALLADARAISAYQTVQIGSIVALADESGAEKWYVLSPAGGGIIVKDGDASIFTLTPDAPLGKRLLGLKVGYTCKLNKSCWTIKEIS